jgi:class 3 adenylate cyclase
LRAASEMLERLEGLNDEFQTRFGSRIGLRIGINTGEVVAGDASAGETFASRRNPPCDLTPSDVARREG